MFKLSFTDADTFEPQEIKTALSVGANKWEGEDEDEDVKVRGSKTFFFSTVLYVTFYTKGCHVSAYMEAYDLESCTLPRVLY